MIVDPGTSRNMCWKLSGRKSRLAKSGANYERVAETMTLPESLNPGNKYVDTKKQNKIFVII